MDIVRRRKKKELYFTSGRTAGELVAGLKKHFKESMTSSDKAIRLSGVVISDKEFEIRPKWEMVFRSRPYKRPPYFRGEVFGSTDGRTTLKLSKTANPISKLYFIPLLLPVYLIIAGLFIYGSDWMTLAGIGTLFFFSGIIIASIFISDSNAISTLVNKLDLKPFVTTQSRSR